MCYAARIRPAQRTRLSPQTLRAPRSRRSLRPLPPDPGRGAHVLALSDSRTVGYAVLDSSTPSATPCERFGDALIASALAACALALYALTQQRAYWSDGRLLMTWIENDVWIHYHLGYLPLAHAAQRVLGGLYGGDPERPLLWLSALCSALAVAASYLAARAFGARRASALAAAALLASAPVAWFYATCVEVHAPHLLASALAALALARARRAGRWGASALLPTVCFLLLFVTHLAGVLLLPALALIVLRGSGRWRWAPHSGLAIALGLAVLAAWNWLTRELPAGRVFAAEALASGIERWSWRGLWSEFALPQLALLALGALGFACAPREGAQLSLGAFGLALLLPSALLVPGFGYEERGAYAIALAPFLACAAGLALDWTAARAGEAAAGGLALAALALSAVLATRELADWQQHYRGADWVEALRAETGNRGLVLALEAWEREAVRKHTRLDALALLDEGQVGDAIGINAQAARYFLSSRAARGECVVITRRLYGSEQGAPLIEALRTAGGEARIGRSGEYWVIAPELGAH